MNENLLNTLKAAGKATEVYRGPDGTTLLILPYGARVLGLFAPGSPENFYWTNPALDAIPSARAFYESGEWHNSGGDRTWLAPEVDFFFPLFPDIGTYWQPREFDPGHYEVVREGTDLRLVNRLTYPLSRTKRKVEVEMSKSFGPAPNPLRHEPVAGQLSHLDYAGYTQHTSLAIRNEPAERSDPVGLWNLIQMPHGGDLLVPTYTRTEPRVLFGTVAPEDLVVSDRLIRYRMRTPGINKIAIRAVATPGRVGYIHPVGDQWSLIIRNFFVNPSGEYVDVPWTDPSDLGYSVQGCNVDCEFGRFSELEYHVPAIGGGTGLRQCDDTSVVWAFRGPREEISLAARTLLTGELPAPP